MQTIIYIGSHRKHMTVVFKLLKELDINVRYIKSAHELTENDRFLKKASLVLVDMAYVRHDAPAIVKKLRTLCGRLTRIVMMAEYSYMAMALAVHAGFDEFIARPVNKEEVQALLHGKKNKLNQKGI